MITYRLIILLLFFNSLTLCSLTVQASNISSRSCEKQALLWCSSVKHENLSHEDTLLLLNLTYWSWARSAMIIQAQKAIAQSVHAAHKLIQTSMEGRMNPARLCSLAGCSSAEWRKNVNAYEQAHAQLVEKLKAYRYASATYAQCIEYILKSEHASPVVAEYAQRLREHAREFLVDTMKTQALSLNTAMETLSKVFECITFSETTRSVMEIVLNFADLGLFNSFAKCDKKYLQCTDIVWSSLAKSYALSNIIWDASEAARVDFYKVHHRMLMHIMCNDDTKSAIASAFNPDGFITSENRKQCITIV